jgi:type II secretory pathway pseudopilin PulG
MNNVYHHSAIFRLKQSFGSFTLIELMAATTVLSVVLLMMVGMQDQMSKAWSNANRRTDANREARAACRLMAKDFSCLALRGTNASRTAMRGPDVTNSPVSFYYFSGTGNVVGSSLTMPTNLAPNTSYLFGVIPRAPRSSNESDFALIGYYVASDTNVNINGFPVTNYNLHRYYKISNAETIPAFTSWIGNKQADSLFPKVASTNDEILARNVCNLQIKVFGSTNYPNGLSPMVNYGSNVINGIYQGNKMHFELTFYPEDIAQKLGPLSAWTNSESLQKHARSYEFRVDCTEIND